MKYVLCGKSGLKLPKISLGLWHNFGFENDFNEAQKMILHAFDQGITHFDLANNYGPPPGSAEINFGKILKEQLAAHRDEMIIASKAGHHMWDGPYGDGASRKSVMANINQSLKRIGLEYFDIFYSHRYDAETPIEETMQTLVDIVKQGKALYIGLSKYPPQAAIEAMTYLAQRDVPCIVFQHRYSLLNRQPETEILPVLKEFGVGFLAFSPLAQGVLTDKYLKGIPANSRAGEISGYLRPEQVTDELIDKVKLLNEMAQSRQQSMAQLALSWVLHNPQVTSLIVGARNLQQLQQNIDALQAPQFSADELIKIDTILQGATLR